jgi:hypothetical protein
MFVFKGDRRMTDNDKSNEDRIAALEKELAALRRPQPRPEPPLHRTIPGQVGLYDRLGNRVQLPDPVPSETTVGGSAGFGSPYQEGPDGTRVWAPDGVPRDPRTGEPLSGVSPGSMGAGPHRSVQHQKGIDHIDRAFPIHRPTPTKE